MKGIISKWLEYAEKDLEAAKILFRNKSYENCIWHCHQALEKYLKGFIAREKFVVRKTHDLLTLLNDTKLNFPKEILDFIQELNAYYQPSRYPDTALFSPLSYKKSTANRILKLTDTTIKWLQFQKKQIK